MESTPKQNILVVEDNENTRRLLETILRSSGYEVTLGTHEGSAVLEVRDDGPGIAPADQAHVFDRFYRGDPAHTRGGAGLGLALARAIVQVHGGRITLESTPGRGTCFRVLLPLAPPAD